MADIKVNYPGVMYGQTISTKELASGAVTGAKLSLNNQYVVVAVPINMGIGTVSVFGGNAAVPVAGTVTGFYAINGTGATAITAVLWGTTAGTIATIPFTASGTSSILGFTAGTNILAAAVPSGDFLVVSNILGTGSATGYVTFQTAN